jgi:hypothetical protein
MLKHSSSFNLEVVSGVPHLQTSIGSFSMTGHTIVDTPIDVYGECEIIGDYFLHFYI